MTRIVGLVVVLAATILVVSAPVIDARNINRTNQRAWDGRENPWDYPNCIFWSPKIRYWVWLCGKPYPVEMPNREDPRLKR